MTVYDVLKRPIITEKSSFQNAKLNQVAFEVDMDATKPMIKDAVEFLFDVTVERVNVSVAPAKRTRRWQSRRVKVRRSAYKKAIVTLAAFNTIDIFEGVK